MFECPVCKRKFPSETETDWDVWFAHLVEEKKAIFNRILKK